MKNSNMNINVVTTLLASGDLVPVKVWNNADTSKLEVLLETKGKSGIYMWRNLDSGKIYVGSAKNLGIRLKGYYNINQLTRVTNMHINRALLKWGYSSFSLSILEYCSIDVLIQREQYYLDLLKPDYNICTTAGSTLGKLHSLVAKEKISKTKKGTNLGEENSFFGKNHSLESRKIMVEAKLGKILSELTKEKIRESKVGKKFTEEHKSNLSLAQSNRKNISIVDTETGIETIYGSIGEAERSMGFPKDSIRANLRSENKPLYKGRYNIKQNNK